MLVFEELGDGEGFERGASIAAFDAGEGQDVFDQMGEAIGFASEDVEVVVAFFGFDHPGFQHF